jgi:prepilin-type N-terminal cleavage/methylation domain-containing protein
MARPRGFTLVEVMVAMVIGMIGIIIMMQVFASAEGQKRTTTGTGDAQSNGAMAIYTLQRDIREAGYGFNAMNALGCALVLPAPASRTLTQLGPVIINPPTAEVPAGDANTDTLLVAYGNGEGSPEGEVITAINGIQLAVQASGNYHAGDSPDRVVAAPSAPLVGCSLTLATVVGRRRPERQCSRQWRRRRRDAVQPREQSAHPGLRRPCRQPDGLRLPEPPTAAPPVLHLTPRPAAPPGYQSPTTSSACAPSTDATPQSLPMASTPGTRPRRSNPLRQTRRSLPACGPEPRRCVSRSSRATARSTRARSRRRRRSGKAVAARRSI